MTGSDVERSVAQDDKTGACRLRRQPARAGERRRHQAGDPRHACECAYSGSPTYHRGIIYPPVHERHCEDEKRRDKETEKFADAQVSPQMIRKASIFTYLYSLIRLYTFIIKKYPFSSIFFNPNS